MNGILPKITLLIPALNAHTSPPKIKLMALLKTQVSAYTRLPVFFLYLFLGGLGTGPAGSWRAGATSGTNVGTSVGAWVQPPYRVTRLSANTWSTESLGRDSGGGT